MFTLLMPQSLFADGSLPYVSSSLLRNILVCPWRLRPSLGFADQDTILNNWLFSSNQIAGFWLILKWSGASTVMEITHLSGPPDGLVDMS